MDTQGFYDSNSTNKGCANIFGLSKVLSSIQIFNVNRDLQENDLQNLSFCAEYGRLILENTNQKPFQVNIKDK